MKRVTDEFYKEQKYAAAVKALREMRGFTTITRARKVFSDIGLEITDDEYYREIEGRLMKEHKDYDRGYLDILLEEVDKRPNAEWAETLKPESSSLYSLMRNLLWLKSLWRTKRPTSIDFTMVKMLGTH